MAKNYNAQRKPLYFGNTMSDSLAKSDEMVCTFQVNFLLQKSFRGHFFDKNIYLLVLQSFKDFMF